jgi:hypothetical protein
LVDNHGQVYVIYALAGLADDWGVRWFTIVPDTSYTPLSPSQIDTVKAIDLPPQEEDGLPSLCRYHQQITAMVRAAILATAEDSKDVVPDPLTEKGIYEAVGPHPMNASKPEEPAPREQKLLSPKEVRNLQQAYINIQHSRSVEEQEDGHRLLVSYLRASMPKQFHKRISCLNRTMLARKLAKYYVVAFPKATDKALPRLTAVEQDVTKTAAATMKAVKGAIATQSVVVDATHSSVKNRAPYIVLAKERGYRVRILWHVKDGRPWNAQRPKPVPEIAYAVYSKYFEEPTEAEGLVEIVY